MLRKEVIQVNLAAGESKSLTGHRVWRSGVRRRSNRRHQSPGGWQRRSRADSVRPSTRQDDLETAGTSLDNVLTVLTHLTRREGNLRRTTESTPSFSEQQTSQDTVEVMLNAPELLVEITVTACIPID